MNEDNQQLVRVLEGAIFAAGEPLSIQKMQRLFDNDAMPEKTDVLAALENLRSVYDERGVELKEVANGWRFQVRQDLAPWVNRLWDEKPQKYSRALLETLSLIAYRQPITRSDIEEVRGVAVSSHIIKTLSERDWIKVVGHRDVPGRPALYATTKAFLDYFNMKSLDELPTLGELKDIDSLNQDLGFDETAVLAAAVESGEAIAEEIESDCGEQESIFDEQEFNNQESDGESSTKSNGDENALDDSVIQVKEPSDD